MKQKAPLPKNTQHKALSVDDHDAWHRFSKDIVRVEQKKEPHARVKKGIPQPKHTPEDRSFEALLQEYESVQKPTQSTDSMHEHPELWMHASLLTLSKIYRDYRDTVTFRDEKHPKTKLPTLDLHHCTEQIAFEKLLNFIQRAHALGERRILVITGRSGVLHQHVPKWLRVMTGYVRDVTHAPVNLGGEGALIVSLRRFDI